MALSPDRGLQLRIVGALALVVGINALVLSVLVWSGLRLAAVGGWSMRTDLGLSLLVGVVLLGAVGLVALQARYGSRTAVAGLGLDGVNEEEGPRNVAGRVRRLATQADVPAPSVAVADRAEPCCLTVRTGGSPTIVVTTGLLDRLDDGELDAALAHEVAHVVNRDLAVVTAVAAIVAIDERLLERERRLRRVLGNAVILALVTGVGILVFALPIVVLGVAYLVVSATARVMLGVNAIAIALFSKTREYAADRGASRLTGDPSGVASALETLEADRPTRDARLHASATLGIVPRPLVFETAESDDEETWVERFLPPVSLEGPDDPRGLGRAVTWVYGKTVPPARDAIRRVLGWRPSTHPATERRIERLRTMERRQRSEGP